MLSSHIQTYAVHIHTSTRTLPGIKYGSSQELYSLWHPICRVYIYPLRKHSSLHLFGRNWTPACSISAWHSRTIVVLFKLDGFYCELREVSTDKQLLSDPTFTCYLPLEAIWALRKMLSCSSLNCVTDFGVRNTGRQVEVSFSVLGKAGDPSCEYQPTPVTWSKHSSVQTQLMDSIQYPSRKV